MSPFLRKIPFDFPADVQIFKRRYAFLSFTKIKPFSLFSRTLPNASTAPSAVPTPSLISENGPTNFLSSVNEGIDSHIPFFRKQPSYQDPKFDIVASGLGSVLHVKLPPQSKFTYTEGTIIGRSPDIKLFSRLNGGWLGFLFKYMSSGKMFLHEASTSPAPASSLNRDRSSPTADSIPNVYRDVLLAPKSLGDIVSLRLDGTSDYVVKRNTFLAATPQLKSSLNLSIHNASFGAPVTMTISGKGHVALTCYGTMLRIVLNQGEKYIANSKNLIAWDKSLLPSLVIDSPPASTNVFVDSLSKILIRLKQTIFESNKDVLLIGPGDFYISSRVKPSFEGYRNIIPGDIKFKNSKTPLDSHPSGINPSSPQPNTL